MAIHTSLSLAKTTKPKYNLETSYFCISMKKRLTFLLLFVSMAATFYPCCSKDNCGGDNVATANHNNQKTEGTCSPFITCGTCPGFTQLTSTIEVPQMTTEKVIHNSTIKPFLLLTYSPSLLQPPRVA